jgi:hypothetical protein
MVNFLTIPWIPISPGPGRMLLLGMSVGEMVTAMNWAAGIMNIHP